jgi:hypothetical protein
MIQPVVQGGIPKSLTLAKAGVTSRTVPANRIWYLAWAAVQYVADATVAARSATLKITAGTIGLALADTGVITASQTKKCTYNLLHAATTINGADVGGTGNLLPLYPGSIITVDIATGQAGDGWTAEGVYYEVPITCP